ncbi:DNA-formamidopyrimidine glycosylase [Leptospira gomenensis]|uniref:DNA-formamidopyrimidine glycosylase n=1 Tax=Leptospira gomenensis TaxID=2484974 RepID=A0A5F1YH06_9LEPT|nr:DNA-formamidopyrimidine glycosylase family protein [Leptospira gomenensis]TGK39251.1 DNA-formamidopyrimidine glycosylase [Leptospira gomenensis]TGK44003.1 DNA-formamidopyrimidine glycosylase [Leptospira gomenensis]TGK48921.1 DNA-formamidopyrimidine glycosylase [Leptospira gomenensis]TGK54631.1 DNA-formamidopyrimidine glycosylase [Leptospira gomenensis]
MPELPDLAILRDRLSPELLGQKIRSIEIVDPIVVRNLIGATPDEVYKELPLLSLERRGPFLNFIFEKMNIVIHPMLSGRFSLDPKYKKKDLCVRIVTEGPVLNYADDTRMGKVYFLNEGELGRIPKYEEQGIDLLSEEFTLAAFLKTIEKSRQQIRAFLMDQSKLSVLGNAYADEALFAAKLHPKTPCNRLSLGEKTFLYESIKKVIADSIEYIRAKNAPLDVKVRDHVKVRNRKNEPCPVCGTTIRRANVLGYDSFFCPVCQPAKGEQFIPWGTQDNSTQVN